MSIDPLPLLDRLETHPRHDDLARLVHLVALGHGAVETGATKLALAKADAETPLGNVLDVLERGPSTRTERALVASLLAHGVTLEGAREGSEKELAAQLLWLATCADASGGPAVGPAAPLAGEVVPAPRGAVVTGLLAVTGILAALHLARLVARLALAYRRPAEVRLTERGVVVRARTEMLGRLLRDRETVIPRGGLVRATRDVRYPSVAMYAGLFALALGSYVGVGLVLDGLRAASLSMTGVGALVVMAGLGLDFALSALAPAATGKCRVLLTPRKGPAVCVGAIDVARADELLAALAKQ